MSRTPPNTYVGVAPINQYSAEAVIGPVARARAPNDRNMPITRPFSDSSPGNHK